MDTLAKLFPDPVNDAVIVIGALIAVYFVWRSGKNKQNSEAVSNYKTVAESQEARIAQLEKDFATEKKENHELRAQVNQLVGENRALKDLLTYQDPNFKKTIEAMLSEMKELSQHQADLREDFVAHALQDDKRFSDIHKSQTEILQAVVDNRDFYAKTIKELK